MNDREKIINSLQQKGMLDESSVDRLRMRLKNKLKNEAKAYEEEISMIKSELRLLQNHLTG